MVYLVEFTAEATADLEALPPIIQERIFRKVRWLSDNERKCESSSFKC